MLLLEEKRREVERRELNEGLHYLITRVDRTEVECRKVERRDVERREWKVDCTILLLEDTEVELKAYAGSFIGKRRP